FDPTVRQTGRYSQVERGAKGSRDHPKSLRCGIADDRVTRLSALFETAPFDRSGTSPSERRQGLSNSRAEHQENAVHKRSTKRASRPIPLATGSLPSEQFWCSRRLL